MNNLQLDFSIFTVLVNALFRLATAVIFLAFIIPLQIKESKVKNGLRKLRLQLLASGLMIFLVNTIGIVIILFRQFKPEIVESVSVFVTYFNTFGFLIVALVTKDIYHDNYSEVSKDLHRRIDIMEQKDKKK